MQYLIQSSHLQQKFSLPGLLLGLFLICSVGLLACGPAATAVPQPSLTPQPSATPQPTATSSPQPSATPQPTATSSPQPPAAPGTLQEPAPIESVTIEVSATDPSPADLVVVSGLPNACYTFGHYSLAREGDAFRVEIVNLIPDDPMLMCAEIYGMVTTRIPLEGGVETCEFYEVLVNDALYSVQAIAPNVRCAGPAPGSNQGSGSEPSPDEALTLVVGQKTLAGQTGLALTLIEVSEDSRCPSDVVCVWAGRATVLLGVEQVGNDLGQLSLSMEGGAGSAPETVEGYTIELLQLDPYPVSSGKILIEEYVATVSVEQS